VHITFFHVRKCMVSRAGICKRLWSPGLDSEESIPPGWELIPGLFEGLQLRAQLVEILKLCWQYRTAETKELRERSECRLLCFKRKSG
jgi:hypothetical protein